MGPRRFLLSSVGAFLSWSFLVFFSPSYCGSWFSALKFSFRLLCSDLTTLVSRENITKWPDLRKNNLVADRSLSEFFHLTEMDFFPKCGYFIALPSQSNHPLPLHSFQIFLVAVSMPSCAPNNESHWRGVTTVGPQFKVDASGMEHGEQFPWKESRELQSCLLHLYFLDQAAEMHGIGTCTWCLMLSWHTCHLWGNQLLGFWEPPNQELILPGGVVQSQKIFGWFRYKAP